MSRGGGIQYKFLGLHWSKTAFKNKLLRYIPGKLPGVVRGHDKTYLYDPLLSPKADIIHNFNTVCDVKGKWLVTFESVSPRTNYTCGWRDGKSTTTKADALTARELKLLEKDNCIAMIALSEAARRIEERMLHHLGYNDKGSIYKKLTVIHPPQKLLLDSSRLEGKFAGCRDKVEFIFVGRAFFRKGGAEAFDVLKGFEGRESFHLTVISSLLFDEGYGFSLTKKDQEKYRRLLTDTPWVTWHESLPNEEVLDLCKKAHVGLLPTYADSYGYSVLEMQAAGCPVITTDIRSLPEINDNGCGWMVHLKKDETGEDAYYKTKDELEKRKSELKEGFRKTVEDIFKNREQLLRKGRLSLERIRQEHDPEEYGRKLSQIYCSAVRGNNGR